ncbi:MAG: PAS domain S-box protein [Calditrichaeota bacterium]|nr:MAG: PAS domain S-box protein [Calditrichota bacterium]
MTNTSKKSTDSFFVRFSSILLIQIIFIFVSFALLFLFPVKEEVKNANRLKVQESFDVIGQQIEEKIQSERLVNKLHVVEPIIQNVLFQMFREEQVDAAILFGRDHHEVPIPLVSFGKFKESADADNSSEIYELIQTDYLNFELNKNTNELTQSIPNTKNAIYYYNFQHNNITYVLVTVLTHDYLVTSKNKVFYVFILLFLGSILISLLTVYFFDKRFHRPLYTLIQEFHSASGGGLGHIKGIQVDAELQKLAAAFNKMSDALDEHQKEIDSKNQNLKHTYSELISSKDFLQNVINSSGNSIITTDSDGLIKIFNNTATTEFGLSTEKAKGRNVNDFFANKIDLSQKEFETDEFETVCYKQDGTIFPAYLTITPIYNEGKEITSFIFRVRDITESKSLHETMIRMDRYYTKGEMAGDIAHEINNFLAILSGNIELMPLLLKKNDPEKIDKKLELMKTTVDRIVKFTDGLLEANDGKASFAQCSMNDVITMVIDFLQPQNKFDFITIEKDVSDSIPIVEVDIGQVQQLLINLVYNAAEAMQEKKEDNKIMISACLKSSAEEKSVVVTIADNGPGVEKEKEEILFVRRFTTKATGHGIGLVSCKQIIDNHQGTISYRYDNGARFEFDIPIIKRVKTVETDVPDQAGVTV